MRPQRLSTAEVQASAVARYELTAASVAPSSVSTARVQVRRATRHRIRPTTSIGQRGPTVAEVFLREPGQHEVQAGSVHNRRLSLLEVQKGERIEVETARGGGTRVSTAVVQINRAQRRRIRPAVNARPQRLSTAYLLHEKRLAVAPNVRPQPVSTARVQTRSVPRHEVQAARTGGTRVSTVHVGHEKRVDVVGVGHPRVSTAEVQARGAERVELQSTGTPRQSVSTARVVIARPIEAASVQGPRVSTAVVEANRAQRYSLTVVGVRPAGTSTAYLLHEKRLDSERVNPPRLSTVRVRRRRARRRRLRRLYNVRLQRTTLLTVFRKMMLSAASVNGGRLSTVEVGKRLPVRHVVEASAVRRGSAGRAMLRTMRPVEAVSVTAGRAVGCRSATAHRRAASGNGREYPPRRRQHGYRSGALGGEAAH